MFNSSTCYDIDHDIPQLSIKTPSLRLRPRSDLSTPSFTSHPKHPKPENKSQMICSFRYQIKRQVSSFPHNIVLHRALIETAAETHDASLHRPRYPHYQQHHLCQSHLTRHGYLQEPRPRTRYLLVTRLRSLPIVLPKLCSANWQGLHHVFEASGLFRELLSRPTLSLWGVNEGLAMISV